jgi:hypothetical protein
MRHFHLLSKEIYNVEEEISEEKEITCKPTKRMKCDTSDDEFYIFYLIQFRVFFLLFLKVSDSEHSEYDSEDIGMATDDIDAFLRDNPEVKKKQQAIMSDIQGMIIFSTSVLPLFYIIYSKEHLIYSEEYLVFTRLGTQDQ